MRAEVRFGVELAFMKTMCGVIYRQRKGPKEKVAH